MFTQFWLQCQCPNCKSWNWLYNGHSSDDLYDEALAIKCWHCGKCHWLDDTSKEIAECTYFDEDDWDSNERIPEEIMNQKLEEIAELGKESPC